LQLVLDYSFDKVIDPYHLL